MKAFSALLDGLVFTPGRNAKIRLLTEYFRTTPDPDRGYGLAVLADTLSFAHAKPSLIRKLANERVDSELYALSYDYVGDLAETTALIWPERGNGENPPPAPTLSEVVTRLSDASRGDVPELTANWLDGLDASGRYALLKVITGGLRAGVSARLTKVALAGYGSVSVNDIEEVWHGLSPPYVSMFAWLEGRADRPAIGDTPVFRPLMLANPLDEKEFSTLEPGDFLAEWKWDGIRVQLAGRADDGRIFSRGADDITGSFPDVAEHLTFDAVLDGELLVVRDGEVAPFNDLQQRLGRKTVSAAKRGQYPCHVRLYDILLEDSEDLRACPFAERRARLEAWFERHRPERMDVSPLVDFDDWAALSRIRATTRAAGIEGLMLKRKDSPYVAGRPKGPWFKLKRDPLMVDCVLMYAQRGHGKRSSFYSDFTFGCWRANGSLAPELVPVGKAYFGFTDKELADLDRWVRNNTTERFGPVRAVSRGLVLEIAFDSVHPSSRHKSGVAMRFPRVHRIRWDKPVAEADKVEFLEGLIEG